jgi:mycothiol synthase
MTGVPPETTDMQTDTAARAAATLPGLVVRPYAGEADLPEIARIQNAEWEADGVRGRTTADELRAWLGHPSEQFDARRDVTMTEVDGRVVAVTQVDWLDATDGVREYRSRCWLDPAYRRRGIGTMLLLRSEQRRLQMAASHDTDRPKVLGVGTAETNLGGNALFRRFGYEPVRWFFDMERRIDGDLPEVPPLPEGIEVRPTGPEHARQVWEADLDAFRDHWGGWDPSDASFQRWLDSPEFDPSLQVVAWDGDEIAGGVLNAIYPEENEALGVQRGWLDSVFTRRAWRRRGLARGLIARSLHLLRERGMEAAVLGVDADNPSGALGLYESVGFAATERFVAYRRPLEEAGA